jgi:DNA recombination protein RmuC
VQTVAIVLICLAAGAALGWLAARGRSMTEVATLRATLDATRAGEARLEQSLRALSYEATVQSHEAVSRAVAPLHETLRRYEEQVAVLEKDRIDAYASLRTELQLVSDVSTALRTETSQLVAALRAPQVRGRWGEHQLRRIVEAAGMLEHCDFGEQVTTSTDRGVVRPDLVVTLHGGRSVVVDAKAPFDAYLTAMEARDGRQRDTQLDAHARALRSHVDALSAKSYWQAFPQTPEFVVLFVPADPFLDAALQRDPTLLEYAFARDIVLATPATLVALLRTVAYSWRSEALARDAVKVQELAKRLYNRLGTLGGHLTKLGNSLKSSVDSYNATIGSLERQTLVTARQLAELGVADTPLPELNVVELAPRRLQAPEFAFDTATGPVDHEVGDAATPPNGQLTP